MSGNENYNFDKLNIKTEVYNEDLAEKYKEEEEKKFGSKKKKNILILIQIIFMLRHILII